ncbi:MAG: Maf family nucleotide pyrophosphatase [Gammaproteobacteria bacterium]|nr:Maf family nucleotide pyrophosphatase [Gammaproteobacteria bacterium]
MSPHKMALVARLGLSFETFDPAIDESTQAGESPEHLVIRLAEAKARVQTAAYPRALIVGSDQIALVGTEILGKPGSPGRARQQLRKASGQRVDFLAGLCLLNTASDRVQIDSVRYTIYFRDLTDDQIDRYVALEQPYNCAGSIKSESLGIALFARMEGDDPTTVLGLPLIRLVAMLANEGIYVP